MWAKVVDFSSCGIETGLRGPPRKRLMKISHLRKRLESNLLGRLRLNVLEQIAVDRVPSAAEQRRYVREQYRSNPCLGSICRALLGLSQLHQIEYGDLKTPENVPDLLRAIENDPFPLDVFAEITNPSPDTEPFGVLITRRDLLPSGYVYEVSILENDFFDNGLGRLEIRACSESPQPEISVLTPAGFTAIGVQDIEVHSSVSVAIGTLDVLRNRLGVNWVDPKSMNPGAVFKPPLDPSLQALLRDKKSRCSIANLPLDVIKPFDAKFCLQLPVTLVETFARFVETRHEDVRRILVYWNGKHFVMSDDYVLYLAYRKLRSAVIPVTIIGRCPQFVTASAVGGLELLPPVGMVSTQKPRDLSGASFDEIEHLIDEHLDNQASEHLATIAHLSALFIVLTEILSDVNATESTIHDFLRRNPIAVDPLGVRIESEVRLGGDYRIDLAIEFRSLASQLLLVELEPAKLEIFTKSGRPRAKITHAVQQVEDWLRWWRENPAKVPAQFDSTIVPTGLVVAGRSIEMSEDDKRRLTHLNLNRQIKVITYDELLSQLESLITQLEQID